MFRVVFPADFAGSRPVNSALEVDLDFETSARAAPQPTVEATTGLEELIKKRIADGIFNDPIRIAPAPPEKKRVQIELDDKKSSKVGLRFSVVSSH